MNIEEIENKYNDLFSNLVDEDTLENIQLLINEGNLNDAISRLRKILRPLVDDLAQFSSMLERINSAQTRINMARDRPTAVQIGMYDDATRSLNQTMLEFPAAIENLKKTYVIDVAISKIHKLKEEATEIEGLDAAFEVLIGEEVNYKELPSIKAKADRLRKELDFYENCINASRSVGKNNA